MNTKRDEELHICFGNHSLNKKKESFFNDYSYLTTKRNYDLFFILDFQQIEKMPKCHGPLTSMNLFPNSNTLNENPRKKNKNLICDNQILFKNSNYNKKDNVKERNQNLLKIICSDILNGNKVKNNDLCKLNFDDSITLFIFAYKKKLIPQNVNFNVIFNQNDIVKILLNMQKKTKVNKWSLSETVMNKVFRSCFDEWKENNNLIGYAQLLSTSPVRDTGLSRARRQHIC